VYVCMYVCNFFGSLRWWFGMPTEPVEDEYV
jgi:hypothetical protein